MPPINVVLAGNDVLLRQAIGQLEGSNDINILVTTDKETEAVKLIREHLPTITVIGITLSEGSGLHITKMLNGDVPILIFTNEEDKDAVFQAMTLGARGYILTWDRKISLKQAITQILDGDIVMSEGIIKAFVSAVRERLETVVSNEPILSGREKEIVQLTGQGLTQGQIGEYLGLSTSTVKTYLRLIYGKLGVHTAAAAVAEAARRNLIN